MATLGLFSPHFGQSLHVLIKFLAAVAIDGDMTIVQFVLESDAIHTGQARCLGQRQAFDIEEMAGEFNKDGALVHVCSGEKLVGNLECHTGCIVAALIRKFTGIYSAEARSW